MTGQWRPLGGAALVAVLCAAILFGLGAVRGTAQMAGVAHSERGPSTVALSTSTATALPSPSEDPEPTDVVAAPRGSSRGPGGLPAVPLATLADPQAVVSGVVHQGAFCARAAVAQIGHTSDGTAMICSYGDGEDQPRWRAIPGAQAGPSTTKPRAPQSTDDDQSDEEESEGEPTTVEPTTAKPTKPPKATSSQSSEGSAPVADA